MEPVFVSIALTEVTTYYLDKKGKLFFNKNFLTLGSISAILWIGFMIYGFLYTTWYGPLIAASFFAASAGMLHNAITYCLPFLSTTSILEIIYTITAIIIFIFN